MLSEAKHDNSEVIIRIWYKSVRILPQSGVRGGFAAPNFFFLVLRPGEAAAQHQKTKVIKRSWYQQAGCVCPIVVLIVLSEKSE